MSPAFAVETRQLTKTFRGKAPDAGRSWGDAVVEGVKHLFRPPEKKTVVNAISLSVEPGEFFGILGSNGAGKTTFLKLLSCLLYPDGGGGTVNGYDLLRQRTDVRRSVVIAKAGGWLGTVWQLTGRENLLFHARLCGIPGPVAEKRADEVLERLEVAHKAHEDSWNWSSGEHQRFALARTFIARAPVVILDEPTSHLDPRAARLVREFAREDLNRRNGQTVIMSTHYLEEADLLCDRVAIFHEGHLLACDTPSRLKRAYVPEQILELRARNYTAEIGERVKQRCCVDELLEHTEDVTTGQVRLRPKWSAAPADPEALRHALEAEGGVVTAVRRVDATLDDVYFHLTREAVK
jgi:ABC-2 type transport system ATP-binding protein